MIFYHLFKRLIKKITNKKNIAYLLIMPVVSIASPQHKSENFLVIADVHLDKSATNLMEINPSKTDWNNDLDPQTFKILIADLNKNIKKGIVAQPAFILILGDIVGHSRTLPNSVVESESLVFNLLKKTFPNTPLFYTFGNNDSLSINYGPFKDQTSSNKDKSPYDVAKLRANWKNGFLSNGKVCTSKNNYFPCIINEDTSHGFYSAYIKPSFRLISLNTVLFSPNRTHIAKQDAIYQLEWLENELRLAKKNGESVLITMHIPPGNNIYNHSNFWLPEEQAIFLKLIKIYQSTIVGILASHTHAEELKVIKDEENTTVTGVYYTAGLSTSHGNAPSVKTFYFSKQDEKWFLSNYETFYFDLNNNSLFFKKLYDFNSYYCNDFSIISLSTCLNEVTSNKMQKYYSAGNSKYVKEMKYPEDIFLITR